MSMTFVEANLLQHKIACTHPTLDVSIKKVGADLSDEYVCFIDANGYYLWCEDDWTAYRTRREKRLEKYTEDGRRLAAEKQKQAIQASHTTVT
jgi:hypothetical protein